MAGSKAGAAKAKQTIYKKYGYDYFARIGKLGGSNGFTGGFYNNHELAVRAGTKGGTISRRGKAKVYALEPGILIDSSKIDNIQMVRVLQENVPLVEIQDIGYAVDESPTIDLEEHSSWFQRLLGRLK